jgi:hypothetical protein
MDKIEIIKKLQECVRHEEDAICIMEMRYRHSPLEQAGAAQVFNARITALGEAIELIRAS